MIPFFLRPIISTTRSRTSRGRLPDAINSSDVYQRLNFRMVSVGPLKEDGAPTTATREPSGRRVFRIGFCFVRSCPSTRATRTMAAKSLSLVNGSLSSTFSTTPLRSAKTPPTPLIMRSEMEESPSSVRSSSGKYGRMFSYLNGPPQSERGERCEGLPD